MFDPFLSDYRPRDNSRVPVAVFGEIGGQKSLADVQDLLASIEYRMVQLRTALGQVDPSKVKDHTKFAELLVDAGNLQTRVTRAIDSAKSTISGGAFTMLPASYTPMQAPFDRLMQAIKQGYPPDGAQVRRGDYDDVVNRIKQIGGVAVDNSQVPQPRAADPDRRFIVSTAPLARAVEGAGRELEKQGGDLFDFYRWASAHKTEIAIVGALFGLWVLHSLFAVAKVAAPHVVRAALPVAAL
jgi:hypothetical protein